MQISDQSKQNKMYNIHCVGENTEKTYVLAHFFFFFH